MITGGILGDIAASRPRATTIFDPRTILLRGSKGVHDLRKKLRIKALIHRSDDGHASRAEMAV